MIFLFHSAWVQNESEVSKMRKIVVLLISIFVSFSCFAKITSNSYPFEDQEYVYQIYYSDFPNPGYSFKFSDNILFIDIPEKDDSKQEEGIYIKERIACNYFMEEKTNCLYLVTETKRFQVLYYEDLICILIDCDNYDTYCGIRKSSQYVNIPNSNKQKNVWIGIEDVNSSRFIKTSSFLTEKLNGNEIHYNGLNNYMWQIHIPWCEGAKGYGTGEWIQKQFFHDGDKILLLNGYVDPNHPDYYLKNGRIKDVLISTEKGDYIVSLNDSSQLQLIDLNSEVSGDIKLTIKSVYEGSHYKDTCLSFFCLLVRK